MRVIDTQSALAFEPSMGLIERFVEQNPDYNQVKAKSLFAELKQFLVVTATMQGDKGKRYSPSPEIDLMWHHFILDDTEIYFNYCELNLGGMLHHRSSGVVPWDNEFMTCAQSLGIELTMQRLVKCSGKGCG